MGTSDVRADIVVIGGGIAGLWLLDALCQAGYSALLLNRGDLGQGQSIAAQGIIHGGMKYFGRDDAISSLSVMPRRWRESLAGRQGPDLRAAPVLAEGMRMWVPPQLGGRLLAEFSQRLMRGQMKERGPDDRPAVLPQGGRGHLFDLDEAVIDVPKVLAALRDLHDGEIRCLPRGAEIALAEGNDGGMEIVAGPLRIAARRVVLTAGLGNEALLAQAGLKRIACQRRPLHQVLIAGMKAPLFLHCIGKNRLPLATITSYPNAAGGYYWYVGGLLAEQGVALRPKQLIRKAKAELSRLLPGADFTGAVWASHPVERAEPARRGGQRPGAAKAVGSGAVIVGWPAKLALAPVLAEKILTILARDAVRPGPGDLAGLAALPRPAIAKPPWEAVEQWN